MLNIFIDQEDYLFSSHDINYGQLFQCSSSLTQELPVCSVYQVTNTRTRTPYTFYKFASICTIRLLSSHYINDGQHFQWSSLTRRRSVLFTKSPTHPHHTLFAISQGLSHYLFPLSTIQSSNAMEFDWLSTDVTTRTCYSKTATGSVLNKSN